jgi:cytochrome b561
MSFREKIAWVNLCALIFVSLLYWAHVPGLFAPQPGDWVLLALCASVGAYILIEVVTYLILRVRNPEDASEPMDERERLIDLKAFRIAYYVFVIAAFASIFVILHVVGKGPGAVGMVVTIAFVVAEAVKNVARIVYHRRGF